MHTYSHFNVPLTSPFDQLYRTGSHPSRLSVTLQADVLLLFNDLMYEIFLPMKTKRGLILKGRETPWYHLCCCLITATLQYRSARKQTLEYPSLVTMRSFAKAYSPLHKGFRFGSSEVHSLQHSC